MDQPSIAQMSPLELSQRLQSDPQSLQLIDVREPEEIAIASIEGFQVLSLSNYGEWYDKIHSLLDPNQETVVLCHHGMRSAQMCAWLQNQGFRQVWNVAGGIEAYASQVDPTLAHY